MKYILASILLISSCARPLKTYEVHKDLKEFVDEFEQEFGVKVLYKVSIEHLEPTKAAVCRRQNGVKEVVVAEKFYNKFKDYWPAIHQVVFHELGHCSLNLAHDNEMENGMPKSIMHYMAFGMETYYFKNIEKYVLELKNKVRY